MTDHARSKASFLLFVTFVAGAAAGFASSRFVDFPTDVPPARPDASMTGRSAGGSTIERFADELGLTDEQRRQIAPIVAETRRSMSALFDQIRPAYGEIIDSARGRIEALLTPEQVAQYRRLLEERYGTEPGTFGERMEDGDDATPAE